MPARFSGERTLTDLDLDLDLNGPIFTHFRQRLSVHDGAPGTATVRVSVTPPARQGPRRDVARGGAG
ncbi:MAG: hypothetical protein ACM32J_08965 [Rhizobacter sp.]